MKYDKELAMNLAAREIDINKEFDHVIVKYNECFLDVEAAGYQDTTLVSRGMKAEILCTKEQLVNFIHGGES